MPDSISLERKKMLQFLGAQLILTPKKKRYERCYKESKRNKKRYTK